MHPWLEKKRKEKKGKDQKNLDLRQAGHRYIVAVYIYFYSVLTILTISNYHPLQYTLYTNPISSTLLLTSCHQIFLAHNSAILLCSYWTIIWYHNFIDPLVQMYTLISYYQQAFPVPVSTTLKGPYGAITYYSSFIIPTIFHLLIA